MFIWGYLFLILTDKFQVDRYSRVLFDTTQTDNEGTFEKSLNERG
jgi:hypothetical protein